MALHTYDPKEVTIAFGAIILEGFADGTFVSVEQNEDAFSVQVGSDGEACRSKSNNRSGRITATLGQWSNSNLLLSAVYNADIRTPNGDGIFPLIVKDNTGTSIFAAEKAWITKPAPSAFGREAESREWVFETDNLVSNVGGN